MNNLQSISSEDEAADLRFMRRALELAQEAAQAGEVPIGAVVVCDGVIVGEGRNRREEAKDPAAHAEFIAIEEAAKTLDRWRLTGCTVYVTLEPCLMCAGLIYQARVSRCVYGASDPKGGALGTLYAINEDQRLNHCFPVTAGVLSQDCATVLKDFFAARRSKAAED